MKRIILAAALALVSLPALAQSGSPWASSCPPGFKFAAGACVRECPAGYEDRGSFCVFRNQHY